MKYDVIEKNCNVKSIGKISIDYKMNLFHGNYGYKLKDNSLYIYDFSEILEPELVRQIDFVKANYIIRYNNLIFIIKCPID